MYQGYNNHQSSGFCWCDTRRANLDAKTREEAEEAEGRRLLLQIPSQADARSSDYSCPANPHLFPDLEPHIGGGAGDQPYQVWGPGSLGGEWKGQTGQGTFYFSFFQLVFPKREMVMMSRWDSLWRRVVTLRRKQEEQEEERNRESSSRKSWSMNLGEPVRSPSLINNLHI